MERLGTASPRLSIIVDQARTASPLSNLPLSGWQFEFLRGKILRSGLTLDRVEITTLADFLNRPPTPHPSLIVGMGERVLSSLTGRKSIDKWHLSPLYTNDNRPFLGTFGFDRLQKQWELGLYLELTLRRAFEQLSSNNSSGWDRTPERFLLNPPLEETMAVLDGLRDKEEIAVDVETGYGQINTVGLAWSESDAIAINVLPERCGDTLYHALMSKIAGVLQSESRKILQNFIYDVSYFSAYGIRVRGEIFDTMWAMKVLWPELKSNLGNVGRIYTRRTYWKDDGKVTDEEGQKKDWGNVRDWTKHYLYNCRDTTGTLDASRNQRADLSARGIGPFFSSYVSRLTEPILEMCANGMPVCGETRERLRGEAEARLADLTREFHREAGSEINPRSPKQVMTYLSTLGVKLPRKFDKGKGTYKESADASSIKKIRLKVPENRALAALQEIKTLDKALSSYINFDLRSDGRLTYSLNGCGTESLRWSGHKDPWDRGFNIQTIPREGGEVSIKSMFRAPPGEVFVEIDLRQAESRFVAYDSADKTLIDMLESGADVHSHVGNAILRQMGKDPSLIPHDEFKATWRQLGKKAGHGLNYGMKPRVFCETVFNELDLVISEKDARLITEAYFGLFPGIRRWHSWVKGELYSKRKLSAPTGWERYFYGRPDDAFKEALSWRAQHTIPYLTNQLMLHLTDLRKAGSLKFRLLAQVHDSLILLVPEGGVSALARVALDTRAGHPMIDLPGGRLWIPREVKFGSCMANLEEHHG